MNIKASYRYQLTDHVKSICIYYFVLLCVYLLLILSVSVTVSTDDGTTISGQFVGMEIATVIFVFVAGLNSFKEAFGMMIQNGISRNTMFIGRILTALTIALSLATIDQIILLCFKALASVTTDLLYCSSLYEQIYMVRIVDKANLQLNFVSFLFNFSLYLGFISVGYLITLLFYRLNKAGKVAVGVGVPVGLFTILPFFDLIVTKGRLIASIAKFLDFAFGISSLNPMNAIITCTLGFIIFSGFSWLLMRRVAVKE